MNQISERIRLEFKNRFQKEYIEIHAPGRVNLIGEHTDYNGGFVMPAAIDKKIVLAMAKNNLDKIRLFSVDMEESFEVDYAPRQKKSPLHWANYILGVADQLQLNDYKIGGFDCVFGGDIPIGAGLSSSAALEGGVALGLSELFELNLSKMEMTLLSQKAENDFVGVQCGIMDQFASIHGKRGHVIKLDCRSLEYELFPFRNRDIEILLCDTKVRRELATSEYNIRRQQCEQGVKVLQQYDPAIKSLRDVEIALLEIHKNELDLVVYNRSKFVLEENERVREAGDALVNNDFNLFGRKMFESHAGLRDLYEVSSEELDLLVDIAGTIEGVYGSRMMGGGFGGCTISLVHKDAVDYFSSKIKKEYREKTGNSLPVYRAAISDGTKRIKL